MAMSTRPHGGRGKRIEPEIRLECEDCGRELPTSTSVLCLDCERIRDAEWDSYWAELDSIRDDTLDQEGIQAGWDAENNNSNEEDDE